MLWSKHISTLLHFRNKIHKYEDIDLLVTYHPAALLRNPNFKKQTWEDYWSGSNESFFEKNLQKYKQTIQKKQPIPMKQNIQINLKLLLELSNIKKTLKNKIK